MRAPWIGLRRAAFGRGHARLAERLVWQRLPARQTPDSAAAHTCALTRAATKPGRTRTADASTEFSASENRDRSTLEDRTPQGEARSDGVWGVHHLGARPECP